VGITMVTGAPDHVTLVMRRVIKSGGDCPPGRSQDFISHTTSSTTYVLIKTHKVTTPKLPNGLVVTHYALGVSLKSDGANIDQRYVRIVINDTIEWDEQKWETEPWLSLSKEVSPGTYTIEIYLRTTDPARPVTVVENFANVGVGTISETTLRVAYISQRGEFRSSAKFGLLEGVTGVTVTCEVRVDDSESDRQIDSITDETGYGVTKTLVLRAYYVEKATFYMKTSDAGRPAFLWIAETRGEVMVT